MAAFPTSTYILILCFLTIHFKSLTAASNSSFYFNNFTQNSRFDSVLALYGDARVSNDGSSVQLMAPLPSSAGHVIYKNHIRFYGGNPKKLVSFSTYFSFSISLDSGNGNGLAFFAFADDLTLSSVDDNGSLGLSIDDGFNFLRVEFDASRDDNKRGDMNVNHVRIDLSNLGLNSGNRLQVWIDYESMSRRLEVRLNKFGENRPIDPLLFEHIDLPKIWPVDEGVLVGLSSWSGNSSQICNVYSWSFKTRLAPDWMHSEPLDPSLLKEGGDNEVKINKKSDCVMRILSALILGVGLGALGSFVGMFLWTVLSKRQPVLPEEYAMKPVVHDKGLANEKQ